MNYELRRAIANTVCCVRSNEGHTSVGAVHKVAANQQPAKKGTWAAPRDQLKGTK